MNDLTATTRLSYVGCGLVLATAFLGWMFAGMQLAVSSLVMRDAVKSLLVEEPAGPALTRVRLQASSDPPGTSDPNASDPNTGDPNTGAPNTGDPVRGETTASPAEASNDAAPAAGRNEGEIGNWYGRLIAAFLFGAAAGGYLFGWIGDRMGRARAMALSILCYSVFSGLTFFVTTPSQLLVLRFITCMGIGGMWPNGIALVSEAWPNISRPFLAGAIGTAANVGIMLFSALACFVHITPEQWRWVPLFGLIPTLLGLFVLVAVPESPRWLALRKQDTDDDAGSPATENSPLKENSPVKEKRASLIDVFRPPILKITAVGILLGTVPLFGGWGSSNWATAWASQVGEKTAEQKADPTLKARVSLSRSLPGSISSLLGGAVAAMVGRRLFYFLVSAAALGCSQYLFNFLSPADDAFMFWYAALGFCSGFFFGWLPLCLPELFPTRVRATGAGVSFNFGRIITAFGVLVAGGLLKEWYDGDYAAIGRATSLIYACGMAFIFLVPRHREEGLED